MGFCASPYQAAASLVAQVWENRCSVKSVVYDKRGNLRCDKRTYAQVCNVLRNQSTLQSLEELLLADGSIKNQPLLYVCLYELLLGPKQSLQGGGVLKRKLLQKENSLRKALGSLPKNKPRFQLPRYARVNTLMKDSQQIIEILTSQGVNCFRDAHVPDLLVASSSSTPALLKVDGIVLQDKSSCFSALCLARGWKSLIKGDFLDACAAPGNKTSHLAALVSQQSASTSAVIHAIERNEKRLQLLKSRLKEYVGDNDKVTVRPTHGDFLKISSKELPNVTSILLDPSCSGSGIVSAERENDDDGDREDRLKKLSNFQHTALHHAMNSFPRAERIVYSTCSIHEEENEEVVRDVLAKNPSWHLISPLCLTSWKNRGHEIMGLSSTQAGCLIRADPSQDETNGFFVACFERTLGKKKSEKQKPTAEQPQLKLPVYDGRFSSSPSQQCQNTTKRKHDTQSNTAEKAAPRKKKRESQSKGGSINTVKGETSNTVESNQKPALEEDKPKSKKIAKKLEWKRRQKEQKQARLAKKTNKS